MRANSATYLYALSTKQASWGSFAWEATKWVPGIGAVPSFIDAGTDLMKGNFLNAGLNAVGGVASLFGGGAIAKGLTTAGKLMATAGKAAPAASGLLNAGAKGLTQAGTGMAKAVSSAGAVNNAVAQGVQKVVPVAQGTTWASNPVRSAVNYAVKNPFEAVRMVATPAPSSAGAPPAAAPQPLAQTASRPQLPPLPPAKGFSPTPPQFRPRPMVNF